MKKVMERKSGAAVRWSAWLGRYRRALDELEKCKSERYYHGTPVMVDCPRYKGPGVAVTDNQCPPDQVAVSLENGNTWWYPMEAVRPNGPSSATRPTRAFDCNRDAMAGFAAAHG